MNDRIFTSIDLLRNLTQDELARINCIMLGMQLSDLGVKKSMDILNKNSPKKEDVSKFNNQAQA